MLLDCTMVCALSDKAESIIRHLFPPVAQIQTFMDLCHTSLHLSSHQSSRLLKEFFSSQRHCDHGMRNDW